MSVCVSLSVYMPVRTVLYVDVSVCSYVCLCECMYNHVHACYPYVCVRTLSRAEFAVYSAHYKARRCLQMYIYAAPQLASSGSPHSANHS